MPRLLANLLFAFTCTYTEKITMTICHHLIPAPRDQLSPSKVGRGQQSQQGYCCLHMFSSESSPASSSNFQKTTGATKIIVRDPPVHVTRSRPNCTLRTCALALQDHVVATAAAPGGPGLSLPTVSGCPRRQQSLLTTSNGTRFLTYFIALGNRSDLTIDTKIN